jgi:hypothetical protein
LTNAEQLEAITRGVVECGGGSSSRFSAVRQP